MSHPDLGVVDLDLNVFVVDDRGNVHLGEACVPAGRGIEGRDPDQPVNPVPQRSDRRVFALEQEGG